MKSVIFGSIRPFKFFFRFNFKMNFSTLFFFFLFFFFGEDNIELLFISDDL